MDFFTRKDSINNLTISNRLRNCLKQLEIDSIGQLLDFPRNGWPNVRNMGVKTIAEVLSLTEELTISLTAGRETVESLPEDQKEFCEELEEKLDLTNTAGIVAEICKVYPEIGGETLIYRVYENELVKEALSHKILSCLNGKLQGADYEYLCLKLPKHLNNTTILEELLLELEDKGRIYEEDGGYIRHYPSVMEFVENISDERKKSIVKCRLSGKTQEETGAEFGLTKERVRQICNKAFENAPMFAEDLYRDLYTKYDLNTESLDRIFHLSTYTAKYLEIRYSSRGKNRLPLKEMLEDDSLSPNIKRAVEAYVYQDYLNVGTIRIQKTRPELFRYVVKTYCKNKTDYSEVVKLYHVFLEEHGLAGNEKLMINSRTYENKIAKCDYALWIWPRSIRYYNIPERNYEEFLSEINLAQYQDKEISTLKIFREHPDLMDEYDIRDEFELHNLLNKIWPQFGNFKVDFCKMPTIRLGNYNIDDQVLDLLLQCAPIPASDFAKEYENEYGVKAATAAGNCLHCIDPYLVGGIYTIDQESLPLDKHNHMKEVLSEEFYTLADIQRLYQREFPRDNRRLNTYNIKTLGFIINSSYAISNTYSNAAVYFRHILTCTAVVDAGDFPQAILSLPAYLSELLDLKKQREIIEFSPKQYINIRRLEQAGTTKEMLKGYCQKVCHFVERNTYFTVTSIRQDGFTHELDELCFDEWFYSSLLAEDHDHFSYRRMGGNRLFFSGNKDVHLSVFLEWILEKEDRIDLDNLIDLLSTRYGLTFKREKILCVLKDTDLYYDQIMDRVYIDYGTYFEEV